MNIRNVSDTVRCMNWVYGRGEMIGDVQVSLDGKAEMVRRKPYCRAMETRKVTILENGRRVRFLGHTRLVMGPRA